MSVPDTARHASSRGRLRGYTGARVQLPHDRHPGRGRPRAADSACPRSSRGGASSPPAISTLGRHCRSQLPVEPPWARTTGRASACGCRSRSTRQAVMQHLLDRGIATRRGVICAHREPAYATEPWRAGAGGLAESERAQDPESPAPALPRPRRGAAGPRCRRARRGARGPDARPDQRAWLTKVARSRSSCSSGGSRRPGRSGPRWRCRSPSSGTR